MFTHDLAGKNVVITGASSGLGRTTAIVLSGLGVNLGLLARREELLRETGSLLSEPSALLLPTDITDARQVAESAQQISLHFPHVDILINNAAGWYQGRLEDIQPEDLNTLISTTITGTALVTKYLLPSLRKAPIPHIVNIVSTAGIPCRSFDHASSSIVYHAAKCGQAAFSEGLRAELAPEGIRVSTLYPGAFAAASSVDDTPQQILAKFGPGVMGVADVVDAILFMISRNAIGSVQSLILSS